MKKDINSIFLNRSCGTRPLAISPTLKPTKTKNKPIRDLIADSWFNTPAKYNPSPKGKHPHKKRKPDTPIKSSFL